MEAIQIPTECMLRSCILKSNMSAMSSTVTSQSDLYKTVTLQDIEAATKRIEPFAHRTPVLTNSALNEITGHTLFFKCENLQKTGAFKFRGAINAISQLTKTQLAGGVVTHSSGNHGAALAAAAQKFGTVAYIIMPSNAPIVKKEAVAHYGGIVFECEPTLKSRIETAERVRLEKNASLIPPFDHPHIIAGQGTCAYEFVQQVPHLDVMMAPVGGGGLLAGTGIASKGMSRRVKVIAGEPEGADDAYRSKMSGELQTNTNPHTIADGLRTNLGEITWPYIREDHVYDIITVSDQEIAAAMKLFMERTKHVIEPSAAVPLAALMSPKMPKFDWAQNIGIILSGGNVDLTRLPF